MRCDRCDKQSYLIATNNDLELSFCRHHGIEHSPCLEEQGWQLSWDVDKLEALLPGALV